MSTIAPPSENTQPNGGLAIPAATLTVAISGTLLGVLTNVAQGWLPGAWNQIANSGAVWSAVAFAGGAFITGPGAARRAAVGGLIAEVGLVLGYYGYAEFGRDGMGSMFFPLVWLGVACLAGPLFGIAAHLWRHGARTRDRIVGLAALAGLFGMEGLAYALDLHYALQASACFAVTVLVPLAMARTARERALTLLTAVPCALLAYAVVALPLQSLSP
ncbi:DUF6518 family protein [Streptomyces sp. NPDC102487]|uniref:DUF6518 family protein n=1 Tax=Streptomyces sp. NPDC102487 TaxID=3366182 RepID=UPI0037F6F114